MIFIFTSIFLTGCLTFCNSVFMSDGDYDYNSGTHFTVMVSVPTKYFGGLWINELPSDIIQKQENTCEQLKNSIVIPDITLSTNTYNDIYDFFAKKVGSIYPLNVDHNNRIVVEVDNEYAHLLPCHRKTRNRYNDNEGQTIYISKLLKYKSLIMLVNTPDTYSNRNELQILGLYVEFIDLQLQYVNDWEFFIRIFDHRVKYYSATESEMYDIRPMFFYINELSVESRVLLFRLCVSILRESPMKVPIPPFKYTEIVITYVRRNFSFIWNWPDQMEQFPSLILNSIQCNYQETSFYLIKDVSNYHNLHVIYASDSHNVRNFEMFYVERREFLDYAFAYIENEI